MCDLFVFGFFLQGSVSSANNTISYFCQEGQYNDMATLFFTSQESAIRHLFHLDGIRAIFFVAYFLPSLGNFFFQDNHQVLNTIIFFFAIIRAVAV